MPAQYRVSLSIPIVAENAPLAVSQFINDIKEFDLEGFIFQVDDLANKRRVFIRDGETINPIEEAKETTPLTAADIARRARHAESEQAEQAPEQP